MPVTIDDIARETGFHRTTVSQVLNHRKSCYASTATRKLIRETARRLDFVPNPFARSLRSRRSHTVGVVLSAAEVVGAQLNPIAEALSRRGYVPLFCESFERTDRQAEAILELRHRGVDGLILDPRTDRAALSRCLPMSLPCVLIRHADAPEHHCVVADRLQAFARGVQWLADRGHRRIAFFGIEVSASMLDPFSTTRHKFEGYRGAMQRLGLFDENLVIDGGPLPFGGACAFVRERGELFRTVTAVLACNDRLAIEVMTGLAGLGLRVPQDISVIGFDDTEFAVAVQPRLTTFSPRRAEVGTKAAEMVLDLIEGKSVTNVTIVPELVERESAGPCRHG